MSRAYKPKVSLNRLPASPLKNPLMDRTEIQINKRWVRTRGARALVDPETGEYAGAAAIYTIEQRDDAEFVKVFADGVKAAFGLSRTATRVFYAVLDVYQRTVMHGGYAEAVELFWFNDGLCGRAVDMHQETFNRGLRELIEKQFLALRQGNSYWTNPSLFFKGDRVAFIREYRRTSHHQSVTTPLSTAAVGRERL